MFYSSALLSVAAAYTLSDFQTKLPWKRPSEGYYEIDVGLDAQQSAA